MKISQRKFWAALKGLSIKPGFLVQRDGCIRAKSTWSCPVIAVVKKLTNKTFLNADYFSAGRAIDLDNSFVEGVAFAADNEDDCDKKLRRKLLETVGLKERSV